MENDLPGLEYIENEIYNYVNLHHIYNTQYAQFAIS